MKRLKVGVLFGGRSAEHEVSLVSAQSVMKALDKNKYEIIQIGITKKGDWISGPDALEFLKTGNGTDWRQVILSPAPSVGGMVMIDKAGSAEQVKLVVLFPVLHGTFGEDGTLQGLLELAGLPYVGAGVLGSSLAMDKILQKEICLQAGLPCVQYLWFRKADWESAESKAALLPRQLGSAGRHEIVTKIVDTLGLPVFVKPPNLGSSVGISKAHSAEELERAIELALEFDRKVIIEKAVSHAREIEVAVLGNENPKASVAGEIRPSNEFYDYNAKYVDGKSDLMIPAELPQQLHDEIRQAAVKAVLATEVEGMARVDFLLDSNTGEFYLNEINTLPGFTSISMYPKLWEATGLSYSSLLDELISLALARHREKQKLKLSYQPVKEWYK